MKSGQVVYSPVAVQRMEAYRARIDALVKDGKLTKEEASVLYHAKFSGIVDRLRRV